VRFSFHYFICLFVCLFVYFYFFYAAALSYQHISRRMLGSPGRGRCDVWMVSQAVLLGQAGCCSMQSAHILQVHIASLCLTGVSGLLSFLHASSLCLPPLPAPQTSDAERIGVDQVAKILPSGKATGTEQREWQLQHFTPPTVAVLWPPEPPLKQQHQQHQHMLC
jgi:hypothetical protein